MSGCGKEHNGAYKVEGAPLRCGVHLYWKTLGKERERVQEIHLCDKCKKEEQQ